MVGAPQKFDIWLSRVKTVLDCSYARCDSIGNDSNVNRNKWFTEQTPIRMPPVFSRANHNNGSRLKLLNILFSMFYTARGRFPSSPWPTMRHSRKTKSTLHSHDFTFETHAQSPLSAVLRYSFTTERVLSLNTRSLDSHLSLLSSNPRGTLRQTEMDDGQ